MSRESPLRRYLKVVRSQIQQCRDVMQQSRNLADSCGGERTRRRPPDVKSQEVLARLFKKCVAELVQSGDSLFELAMPRLEALRECHDHLVSASWDLWKMGAIPNSGSWDAITMASGVWEDVDHLVEGVERKLDSDDTTAEPRNPETPSADRISFDDLTTTITLDGAHYQIDDPAAYRIVKFLHGKAGETIKGPVIQRAVPGLGGRNAIGEKIKKLPKTIQVCVHGIRGTGYFFSMPQRRKRKT